MGLILDTSVLIADERGKIDLLALLAVESQDTPLISTITAAELLLGIEQAISEAIKNRRRQSVEEAIARSVVVPFTLAHARTHAQIRQKLIAAGTIIGAHDLLIAATALALGHKVATLNISEFSRVPDLAVLDATPFLYPTR